MKSQELRVGNLVYRYIGELNDLKLEIYRFTTADFNYLFRFEPIPLTEEILLKASFKKNTDPVDGQTWFELEHFFLLKEDNGYYLASPGDCSMEYAISESKPMTYLNQLQNLYFDVKQKELEVKL
jgi:hypothetical protein